MSRIDKNGRMPIKYNFYYTALIKAFTQIWKFLFIGIPAVIVTKTVSIKAKKHKRYIGYTLDAEGHQFGNYIKELFSG